MKILRTKSVVYKNHIFRVPEWTKYMCVDKDGNLWVHEAEPRSYDGGWHSMKDYDYICDVELESIYWTASLENV